MTMQVDQLTELKRRLHKLRGDESATPDVAVIIPFNAQADPHNLLPLLEDVAAYRGANTVEVVLVLNNYPPDQPAPHAPELEALGLQVVCVPNARRPGEAVAFSARLHGLRAARAERAILFDADCRVPDATALFDWYAEQLRNGAEAAYTPVSYYNLSNDWSIHARVLAHHLARWGKRALLGIPTTRGGNYAVDRHNLIRLYEQGYLADEMNVGPAVKAHGGRVAYSGSARLRVLTSGDRLRNGWRELGRYLLYRLRYNINVLPVRPDAASHTKRNHSNKRGYAVFADERASARPDDRAP